MMFSKRIINKIWLIRWRICLLLTLILLVTLYVLILYSSKVKISFPNGALAQIKTASFLRSIQAEAYTTITCESKNKKAGSVVLWQSVFDGPILLIPSSETNVLLCLYDYDTELRLFRIDTGKTFEEPDASSDIKSILFSSSWDIHYGSYNDWQQLLNFLKSAPSNEIEKYLIGGSFRFRRHNNQIALYDILQKQGFRGAH